MLTISSPFKIHRLPRIPVEKLCGKNPSSTSIGFVTELEAALRGEIHTECLLNIHSVKDEFSFVCADRTISFPYKKETLARHSLLIRGFIEDYPEANEIDLSKYHSTDVILTLRGIFGLARVTLTPIIISILQLLTPPNDLYYFLFDLPSALDPSFIMSILRGITEEERYDLIERYQLYERRTIEDGIDMPDRTPPNQGRDLAIAFYIDTVRSYLRSVRVPEIHDKWPSFTFYEMVNYSTYEAFEEEGKYLLLTATFDDDSGILVRRDDRSFLIEEIFGYFKVLEWEDCCTILGMLGLRHPSLGNENVTKMAPYQIELEEEILDELYWLHIRQRLEKIAKVPMALIDELMKQYIKE